jgi:selenoprotein W-related protein
VAELLADHEHDIARIVIVPDRGGVFEVDVDGALLYSKKATGRHAEPGEIRQLLAAHRTG